MQTIYEILKNIGNNFTTHKILWLVLIWVVMSTVYRIKKRISPPSYDKTTIKFYETFVSGTSYENIFRTIFGGARNCLSIIVNDKELYIRKFFILDVILPPEIFGLECRISKDRIISVERGIHSFRRDSVLITFYDLKGKQKKIELYMQQPKKFISAIDLTK